VAAGLLFLPSRVLSPPGRVHALQLPRVAVLPAVQAKPAAKLQRKHVKPHRVAPGPTALASVVTDRSPSVEAPAATRPRTAPQPVSHRATPRIVRPAAPLALQRRHRAIPDEARATQLPVPVPVPAPTPAPAPALAPAIVTPAPAPVLAAPAPVPAVATRAFTSASSPVANPQDAEGDQGDHGDGNDTAGDDDHDSGSNHDHGDGHSSDHGDGHSSDHGR
jgi:hypothetical protein